MTKRIAVLTTSFPASDGDPSGHFVRAHARALAASLKAEGNHTLGSVHVIAPFGRATDPPFEQGSIVVHPAGGSALFGFPGALARGREDPTRWASAAVFAAGARRRLRELSPLDLVVAHWIVPSAWPICAGISAPLAGVAHGADVRLLLAAPARARAAIVGALLDRGARLQFVASHLLDALAISLPSSHRRRLMDASFVEPAPIELPDVSTDAARLRGSLGLRADQRLVVCAGRLVPEKRVDLAVMAACVAGAHLVVVGDGPERARLAALARARSASVTWAGLLPRDQALAWIAAADVLVHTAKDEGAPTVVREARALGRRVVACAAGDLALWATKDSGIVIAEPEPSALAERIRSESYRHACV